MTSVPSPIAANDNGEKSYISEQPTHAQPMSTAANHLNSRGVATNADGQRAWSYDFFSCTDDLPLCCLSCWCPWSMHQNIKMRKDALIATGQAEPNGGEYVGKDCAIFCGLTYCFGLGCLLDIPQRAAVRARYNIEGSSGLDIAATVCCIPCSQTQQSREIAEEEKALRGQQV